MKITYDHEVDALYIQFKDTTVTTKHLADGIAADYDAQGRLAGIEILDAMKRLDDPTTFRQVILEMLLLPDAPEGETPVRPQPVLPARRRGRRYPPLRRPAAGRTGVRRHQSGRDGGALRRAGAHRARRRQPPAARRGQAAREPKDGPDSQRQRGHGPGRRAGGVGVKTI